MHPTCYAVHVTLTYQGPNILHNNFSLIIALFMSVGAKFVPEHLSAK